mgnify:CR=1 FL=1
MKKIKRISLVPGIQILDAMSQKQLRGAGNTDPNVCHSKSTRESCSGSCVDYEGYSGSCAWVDATSSCRCAIIYVG